jgi:hypothetical protein
MHSTTGTRIVKDGLDYFLKHMGSLLSAAAVPALLVILASLAMQQIQTQNLTELLRQGTPVASANPMSGKLLLVWLVSLIASLWLSVRVYRYRLREEFPVMVTEASSLLWLFLYNLLLLFLYIVAVIIIAFVLVFAITIVFIAMGASPESVQQNPQALLPFGLAGMALLVMFYLFVIYCYLRFQVAFPGIALGRRESVFNTMWPMGRGVTLSLMLWFVLALMAMVAIAGAALVATGGLPLMYPTLVPEGTDKLVNEPQVVFRYQLIFGFSGSVLGVIFHILYSTILAEGYVQLNRPKTDVFA